MTDNLSTIMETIGLDRYQELKAGGATDEEISEAVQRVKTNAEESNVVIFPYTPDFVKPIKDKSGNVVGERICAPLLADHIRENLHYFFVRDGANSAVRRYVYKGGCYRLISDDEFKGEIKAYIKGYNPEILRSKDVNEVFFDLTTDSKWLDDDQLNADENIINFQNGVLHLDTMELKPHSPNYLSTIQIPCDWTEDEPQTPVYDSFLETLTVGDGFKKMFLEQFMGVAISNVHGYRMKKALFMVGKGDTGKSQLKKLTERLLGNGNYTGVDLEYLERRFGSSALYNKRLAGSSDMGFITVRELRTFKLATGGDTIRAEFKGQDGFEFTYNGVLWFCANRKPKFGGDRGDWVYDRMVFIDCKNVIPKEKQDKELLNKMYAERAGIVKKAVKALKIVIGNGYSYTNPPAAAKSLEEYKVENNSILSFIAECVVPRPAGFRDNCTTKIMFDVYKAWCADNNNGYAETKRSFNTEFAAHFGYESIKDAISRTSSNTYFTDYTLSKEAKRDYARIYGYDSIT